MSLKTYKDVIIFLNQHDDTGIQQHCATDIDNRLVNARLFNLAIKKLNQSLATLEYQTECVFHFNGDRLHEIIDNHASGKVLSQMEDFEKSLSLFMPGKSIEGGNKDLLVQLKDSAILYKSTKAQLEELVRKSTFARAALSLTEEEENNLYLPLETLYANQPSRIARFFEALKGDHILNRIHPLWTIF